jgi:hypothetical protein
MLEGCNGGWWSSTMRKMDSVKPATNYTFVQILAKSFFYQLAAVERLASLAPANKTNPTR